LSILDQKEVLFLQKIEVLDQLLWILELHLIFIIKVIDFLYFPFFQVLAELLFKHRLEYVYIFWPFQFLGVLFRLILRLAVIHI